MTDSSEPFCHVSTSFMRYECVFTRAVILVHNNKLSQETEEQNVQTFDSNHVESQNNALFLFSLLSSSLSGRLPWVSPPLGGSIEPPSETLRRREGKRERGSEDLEDLEWNTSETWSSVCAERGNKRRKDRKKKEKRGDGREEEMEKMINWERIWLKSHETNCRNLNSCFSEWSSAGVSVWAGVRVSSLLQSWSQSHDLIKASHFLWNDVGAAAACREQPSTCIRFNPSVFWEKLGSHDESWSRTRDLRVRRFSLRVMFESGERDWWWTHWRVLLLSFSLTSDLELLTCWGSFSFQMFELKFLKSEES